MYWHYTVDQSGFLIIASRLVEPVETSSYAGRFQQACPELVEGLNRRISSVPGTKSRE